MRQYLIPVLVFTLSACATSRNAIPPAKTTFPQYSFEALQGLAVRLTVLDQRPEQDDSDLLVSRIQESLRAALKANSVTVDPGGEQELEVRITQLRSDFELGNWRGCTRMTARLRRQDMDERIEADRCVTRSNMFGYRSANEALAQSFHDALAQLLSEIDAL